MFRLIYVSSATLPLSSSALDALLEVCRRNNQNDDITGMLLYRDGDFLQILEGKENTVKETYRRITADSRHRGIILLDESPISQREFSEWSMGFRRINSSDIPIGFMDFFSRGFNAETIADRSSVALQFLLNFKQIGR